jgi:hypothetical protein
MTKAYAHPSTSRETALLFWWIGGNYPHFGRFGKEGRLKLFRMPA